MKSTGFLSKPVDFCHCVDKKDAHPYPVWSNGFKAIQHFTTYGKEREYFWSVRLRLPAAKWSCVSTAWGNPDDLIKHGDGL